MLRVLWDAVYDDRIPDFKEKPYDLGSFNEIVHHNGRDKMPADSFEGRLTMRYQPEQLRGDGDEKQFSSDAKQFSSTKQSHSDAKQFSSTKQFSGPKQSHNGETLATYSVVFGEQWSSPMPVKRKFSCGGYWITQYLTDGKDSCIEVGSPRGTWKVNLPHQQTQPGIGRQTDRLKPLYDVVSYLQWVVWPLRTVGSDEHSGGSSDPEPDNMTSAYGLTSEDLPAIDEIQKALSGLVDPSEWQLIHEYDHLNDRPFATAPVRSEPQRTYDPRRVAADSLGDYVPTYLAQLSQRDQEAWEALRSRLEEFGRHAGLFCEIRVRPLGDTDVDPFKVQVRKFTASGKGPFRSLVDVGYGISQVLPVAFELLRGDGPENLLLQQPEVHLHPSAQAALGTLICEVVANRSTTANRGRIIVETHSDYIIDRVRMAVADPETAITPDDVSIVYFERDHDAARLHSLSVDEDGNIVGAPPGYRQFFLDEIQRSVGF